jgi:hypothetical protein
MTRELLQEFVDAYDTQTGDFDPEAWLERVRAALAIEQVLPADILERPATRRELPAYLRSVPGVVTPGPGVDIDAVHMRGARAE